MSPAPLVPPERIRALWDQLPWADGAYVLYWMTAARRARSSFALDRALDLAREVRRPLLVLEALRCDYRWASDRLHRFILDGMRANEAAFEGSPVAYYPYVEPSRGAGQGLLDALAGHACVVVTDDFPCFFLPRMLAHARLAVRVRFETVDSNGIFPMRATDRIFVRAHDFRRFLQRELRPHLARLPRETPLARLELPRLERLPGDVARRWARAAPELLAGEAAALAALPIDHAVAPVDLEGGARAGEDRLARFVDEGLGGYDSDRNDPSADGTSGLSPYLHFGHVSAHQLLARIAARESWSPEQVAETASGRREGWWNMSPAAEAFLDQLVTWRELGFNACAHDPGHDRYEALPDWARTTLADHADDEREPCYDLATFERAGTHDELWNAAQNQLRRQGKIHNYLRMLWGKKILHWSATPQDALAILIELNNKYALDGRDPNSYTGILWTLGKYDRPWGPERPIFGKVRYMTSDSTRRKLRVNDYVKEFGCAPSLFD